MGCCCLLHSHPSSIPHSLGGVCTSIRMKRRKGGEMRPWTWLGSFNLVSWQWYSDKCFRGLCWGFLPFPLPGDPSPCGLSCWSQETCELFWKLYMRESNLSCFSTASLVILPAVTVSLPSLWPRLKSDPRNGTEIAKQRYNLRSRNHPYY